MLWPGQENTIKKQLFDLEVKGQGHTKVIMVCDIPPYGRREEAEAEEEEKIRLKQCLPSFEGET